MIKVTGYQIVEKIVKVQVTFDHRSMEYTREYGWNLEQIYGVSEAQAITAIKGKVTASRAEIDAEFLNIEARLTGLMNRDLEV